MLSDQDFINSGVCWNAVEYDSGCLVDGRPRNDAELLWILRVVAVGWIISWMRNSCFPYDNQRDVLVEKGGNWV